jgi:hypothetical protein
VRVKKLRYQHLLTDRIGKSLQAKWQNWQNERLRRDYYRAQSGESSMPRGRYFLKDMLVVFVASLFIFWFFSSLILAAGSLVMLTAGRFYWRYYQQKKEDRRLKKACFAKVTFREYEKRLAKTSPETILQVLQQEIGRQFPVEKLRVKQGILEGEWKRKKLAIVYLEAHGGLVAGREVLQAVRKCYQAENTIVRIFSNGDFEEGANRWSQLFNIDLRLYNKNRLSYFLRDTLLFPSVTEVKEIIEHEKNRRQRKLSLVKKELLRQNRFSGYLLYGVFLLFLAWNKIGIVALNLFAGLVLLGIALFVVMKNFFLQGKEDEQEIDNELYFAKKGL